MTKGDTDNEQECSSESNEGNGVLIMTDIATIIICGLTIFMALLYLIIQCSMHCGALKQDKARKKALEDFEEELQQVGYFMEKDRGDPEKPKLKLVVNNK